MKTIIAFVACIALAVAGTVPFNVPVHYRSDNPEHSDAQIVQFLNDNNGVGPYNFAWVFFFYSEITENTEVICASKSLKKETDTHKQNHKIVYQ